MGGLGDHRLATNYNSARSSDYRPRPTARPTRIRRVHPPQDRPSHPPAPGAVTSRCVTLPSKNQAWLDLTAEEALEPELPICDPHHHLWDKRPSRVSERYLLDELLEDTNSGH